jgi:predicted transposase/invertase (TIGR01784 family)
MEKPCYNQERKEVYYMGNDITKKTLQDLNLEDDFLFAKVMGDKEICRKVLEKILGVPIREVVIPTTQRTIDILLESKGVRLDVYVNDDKGTVYNVEMQRGRKVELPKRSRYYQGTIDIDLISAGKPYADLKKSFIIFICTFDPFQDGRHIYTFENTCQENRGLLLNDETVKIFLNTKGKLDDIDNEMKEFLAYIEDTTDSFADNANSPLVKEIHRKVTAVKQSKDLEVEFMTLLMRDRENREEGIEQSMELTKLLLKDGRLEDLERAVEDPEYRNGLFEEYGL